MIYNKFVYEWTNYVIVDGRQLVVYGPGDVVCICVSVWAGVFVYVFLYVCIVSAMV